MANLISNKKQGANTKKSKKQPKNMKKSRKNKKVKGGLFGFGNAAPAPEPVVAPAKLDMTLLTHPIIKTFKENNKKGDTLVIVLSGSNCKKEDANVKKNYARYLKDMKISENNINIVCDEDLSKILPTNQSVLGTGALYDNLPQTHIDFVNALVVYIKTNLPKFQQILLFGKSYGAALLNKAAEQFADISKEEQKKVKIATFGSFYVSNKIPSDIDVVQYMSLDDLALEQNGLKQPRESEVSNVMPTRLKVCKFSKKNEQNVIFVCLSIKGKQGDYFCQAGASIIKPNPDKQLIHNSYDALLRNVMVNVNTQGIDISKYTQANTKEESIPTAELEQNKVDVFDEPLMAPPAAPPAPMAPMAPPAPPMAPPAPMAPMDPMAPMAPPAAPMDPMAPPADESQVPENNTKAPLQL